jgi:hypothetical protein
MTYVNRNERGVKMGCIINIENIVTNGLKDNSNVSVGCVVQNSHTANTKSVGACFSFGNGSPAIASMTNSNIDFCKGEENKEQQS